MTTSKPLAKIDEVVVDDDGALSLYLKSPNGESTSVRIGLHEQGLILHALLGSSFDPFAGTSRRFQPMGLSRFKVEDDVGLSFLIGQQIALHLVLDRSLAEALTEMLATFDDASTWRAVTVN